MSKLPFIASILNLVALAGRDAAPVAVLTGYSEFGPNPKLADVLPVPAAAPARDRVPQGGAAYAALVAES